MKRPSHRARFASAGLLLSLSLPLAACTEPKLPIAEIETTAPTATTPSAEPAAPTRKTHEVAWYRERKRNSGYGLAIAPWGDVLIHDGDKLRLLARHDGRQLDAIDICGRYAVGFVDAQRAAVVCKETVHEVRFPGMPHRRVAQVAPGISDDDWLRRRVVVASVSTGGVAVGRNDGSISVLGAKSYQEIFSSLAHKGADLSGIALSNDGSKLAVSIRRRGLAVYAIGTETVLFQREGVAGGVAFSPDGKKLFFASGEQAVVVDASDGRVLRKWPNDHSLWPLAFGVDPVGVQEHEELFRFGKTAERLQLPLEEHTRIKALAVSTNGALICFLDDDGRAGCSSDRPLVPTRYEPPPKLVGKPWRNSSKGDK